MPLEPLTIPRLRKTAQTVPLHILAPKVLQRNPITGVNLHNPHLLISLMFTAHMISQNRVHPKYQIQHITKILQWKIIRFHTFHQRQIYRLKFPIFKQKIINFPILPFIHNNSNNRAAFAWIQSLSRGIVVNPCRIRKSKVFFAN